MQKHITKFQLKNFFSPFLSSLFGSFSWWIMSLLATMCNSTGTRKMCELHKTEISTSYDSRYFWHYTCGYSKVGHVSLPFYLVHQGRPTFPRAGDANSDMRSTMDQCSLLTNSLPVKTQLPIQKCILRRTKNEYTLTKWYEVWQSNVSKCTYWM